MRVTQDCVECGEEEGERGGSDAACAGLPGMLSTFFPLCLYYGCAYYALLLGLSACVSALTLIEAFSSSPDP